MSHEFTARRPEIGAHQAGVPVPRGVVDQALRDDMARGEIHGVDEVLADLNARELPDSTKLVLQSSLVARGVEGVLAVKSRVQVFGNELKRQEALKAGFEEYIAENPEDSVTAGIEDEQDAAEALRDYRRHIHWSYLKESTKRTDGTDSEYILKSTAANSSIGELTVNDTRRAIDEKMKFATIGLNYTRQANALKAEEMTWLDGVWANPALSAAQKLEKLADSQDWIMASRELPGRVANAITGINSAFILKEHDRVDPSYQAGLVVETAIDRMLETVQESGEMTVPEEFSAFLETLGTAAVDETAENGYADSHVRDRLEKSKLARSFLAATAGYMNDAIEPGQFRLADEPARRAEAVGLIVDKLGTIDVVEKANLGAVAKDFRAKQWWYGNVVLRKLDNPYIAEQYLVRLEADPAMLRDSNERASHDRLHAQFVEFAYGLLERVGEQTEIRNSLAESIPKLLKVISDSHGAGRNREDIIAVANAIKKHNGEADQRIEGSRIEDTFDAFTYLLGVTHNGEPGSPAERHDAVYSAIAYKILQLSGDKHAKTYLKALEKTLAGGQGLSSWYRTATPGAVRPRSTTGRKTPGMKARDRQVKGPNNLLS